MVLPQEQKQYKLPGKDIFLAESLTESAMLLLPLVVLHVRRPDSQAKGPSAVYMGGIEAQEPRSVEEEAALLPTGLRRGDKDTKGSALEIQGPIGT